MPNSSAFGALFRQIFVGAPLVLMLAGGLTWQSCRADQDGESFDAPLQREADYRVVAARCGTPAFEKQFFKQSKAAVAAGIVMDSSNLVTAEKLIESRRRNPLQLVTTGADCTEKLAMLRTIQQQRAKELRTGRR